MVLDISAQSPDSTSNRRGSLMKNGYGSAAYLTTGVYLLIFFYSGN